MRTALRSTSAPRHIVFPRERTRPPLLLSKCSMRETPDSTVDTNKYLFPCLCSLVTFAAAFSSCIAAICSASDQATAAKVGQVFCSLFIHLFQRGRRVHKAQPHPVLPS